jgi:hypothetical protein
MKKTISSKIAAQSAAMKRVVKSAKKIATGTAQRRRTFDDVRREGYSDGYNDALRTCAESLISDGLTRDYIADIFGCGIVSMGFPTTDNPNWWSSWNYTDWNEWVAAEESESESAA